jgi:alkylated DNA repair dioxygenase AlkB
MTTCNTIQLGEDAYLDIYLGVCPNFLPSLSEELLNKLNVNSPIMIYGREMHQHRSIGFFSNESVGYKYSNQIQPAQPLTPLLSHFLDYVNTYLGFDYNAVLVNYYKNGEDTIGAHSDDTKHLSGDSAISCGAKRKFRIREKKVKGFRDFDMPDGCLIIMRGKNFQSNYTHEIPAEKTINESRMSLTFRHHTQ